MTKRGFTPCKFSKRKIEIPKQVRDDSNTGPKQSCHAELVSASDLNKARKRLSNRLVTIAGKVFSTTGFTLVEVVITLTILGFICLIVFGAFRLGLSAWERGESVRDEYQEARIVSQLITQQVKSTVPFKIKPQQAEGDYLAFEGDARSLKFVSSLSVRGKQPEGLVYAKYEFKEEGSEGGRLVLYEERALNKDFFAEEPNEEGAVSLLEGVSSVRFEYFREEDLLNNIQEEWVEEWKAKDEKKLPKAFRMTIIRKNQKGKEEPPITVFASVPAFRFEEVRPVPGRRVPGMSTTRY
jgi:prepilin-type N-terminal cleavage/methylation domain-containing protein